MSKKSALDMRVHDNYIAHNHAEVMRIAYMAIAHLTDEQIAMVLRATEIPLFADDKVVSA